jgi:hypothetical protein
MTDRIKGPAGGPFEGMEYKPSEAACCGIECSGYTPQGDCGSCGNYDYCVMLSGYHPGHWIKSAPEQADTRANAQSEDVTRSELRDKLFAEFWSGEKYVLPTGEYELVRTAWNRAFEMARRAFTANAQSEDAGACGK